VANTVEDALAESRVVVRALLPITPERVLRWLQERR
jgi:hypothetical protein